MSDTPVEVQFTSAGCLNYPCRTPGAEPKTTTIDLGKKVVAVARSVGCLDEAALEQLSEIRAKLEKHRMEGMTPKNMKLIRQVLNGEFWERVVNCPTTLMKQARSIKDRAPSRRRSWLR